MEMLSLFLPVGMLDYFDLVNHVSQETCFILFLEEKPSIPQEYSHLHLHSKGFFPEIEVQDFPIRGKAVYLRVKRRRWENPEIPQIVTLTRKQDNISDSSKLCSECFNFSDCPDKYFLPAILGRIIARTLHKKRDVSILTHLFHIY